MPVTREEFLEIIAERTRKNPNPPLAEKCIEACRVAEAATRRWLAKGEHSRRCRCDFCKDARKIVRFLRDVNSILGDQFIPFGSHLRKLADFVAETPVESDANAVTI